MNFSVEFTKALTAILEEIVLVGNANTETAIKYRPAHLGANEPFSVSVMTNICQLGKIFDRMLEDKK